MEKISEIYTTVILAMSADGKITDYQNSAARFGSENDKNQLEKQISLVDAVIFGANTLRSYGTTLPIKNPAFLNLRKEQNKPPQPIQIVRSNSGQINPKLRFFSQQVPRWLITSVKGAKPWQNTSYFDKILIINDWLGIFAEFQELGIEKLAILGGGELVSSLLKLNLINEFCLTICPLILGGKNTPSPVGGDGFLQKYAPRLKLIDMSQIKDEIFLKYKVI
jgi:5-amino-6-(5-phosphoribosylamino)uracil reductase